VPGAQWCQADVALGEDCLVGPFDFDIIHITTGPYKKVSKIQHRYWEELERVGARCDVGVSGIRKVQPFTTTP